MADCQVKYEGGDKILSSAFNMKCELWNFQTKYGRGCGGGEIYKYIYILVVDFRVTLTNSE